MFIGSKNQALPIPNAIASWSVSQTETTNVPSSSPIPPAHFWHWTADKMQKTNWLSTALTYLSSRCGSPSSYTTSVQAQEGCWVGDTMAGISGRRKAAPRLAAAVLVPAASNSPCNYSITLLTKSSRFTKTLPGLQSCTISTSPAQDAYCQSTQGYWPKGAIFSHKKRDKLYQNKVRIMRFAAVLFWSGRTIGFVHPGWRVQKVSKVEVQHSVSPTLQTATVQGGRGEPAYHRYEQNQDHTEPNITLQCSRTSMLKGEAAAMGTPSSEKPPWQDLQCGQKPWSARTSHLVHVFTLQPGIQTTFIVSGDTCTSQMMSSDGTILHADTVHISQLTQVDVLTLDPLAAHATHLTQPFCFPAWLM